MPSILQIRTIQDIEVAIQRIIEEPLVDWVPEIDEDFVLNIKIDGRTWDGLIDVRVARYVQELQKVADRSIKFSGPEIVLERPLVKVRVKDGSTEIQTRAVDLFESLVINMNEQQKFIIALTILGCAFAGWTIRSILQHLERKNAQLAQGDAVRQSNEIAKLAIEKIDPEKPVRALINDLRERDTIKLSSDPAPLTKEEARARYPRRPRINPIDVLIDDNYQVSSIRMGTPTHVELSRGDHSFRAELSNQLEHADRDAFLESVKQALETGITQRVPLQVDARVNDKIMHAVIVGIGKVPRENVRDLDQLLD